jgi:hypothetical protein
MEQQAIETKPLIIKDAVLLAIATGKRAQNLKELRDGLQTIHSGSLYFHFWGNLLHPRFEEREYNNDFAAWARHALHDKVIAERLSVIGPTPNGNLDELRQELVDAIEQRLDEREFLTWAQPDQQFEFIRSEVVIFETRNRVRTPEELARQIGRLSVGSIFYHFVDARTRNDNRRDDFSNWLSAFGPCGQGLLRPLSEIDPYFMSLTELRVRLDDLFSNGLGSEVSRG